MNRSSNSLVPSETGSGTWKKSDHYESRANGSVSESGSGLFGPLDWYTWGTNLRFQASTSLDVETVRDSKSTATFNWSNDEWTVTEKTKTSGRSHDYRVSEFGAQLWHSFGNVGAGNGSVETGHMSWSSTRRDDVTESSETTKSITSGKGGVVWTAKYTSRENDVTTLSLDEVRHSESHGRLNTVTNGDYSTAKSDGYKDLAIHNKSKQGEETNEHWESSFDGKAYGATIDTFDETIASESTTFNKWDYETLTTSKSWNASGIISQDAWGLIFHTLTEGSTSSTETEIDTSAGYQPTFMGESLLGKGIFTAVSMSGAGAAGTSKFSFSIPTLTFTAGGAITLGQLPEVRLGTTDFDQIGQAGGSQSYWEQLADLVVIGSGLLSNPGAVAAEAALETAVWVVEETEFGDRDVVNDASDLDDSPTDYQPPTGYLDGVGRVWIGYWNGTKSFAGGIYTLGRHPIDSAKGIYAAGSDPGGTAKAIVNELYDKSGSLEGQGEIAGDILIGIASGGAAKALKEAAHLQKIAKLAKAAEKASDAADTAADIQRAAKALDKVSDAADAAADAKKATAAAAAEEAAAAAETAVTAGSNGLKDIIKQASGMSPKQAGEFFGWGRGAELAKGVGDFTKEGLIKSGFTKEALERMATAYERIAKTLSPNDLLNGAAPARAKQIRDILEQLF